MTDLKYYEFYVSYHQDTLRKLRDKYEKENNVEISFTDFALLMLYSGINLHDLNYN